jgi:hypothetical protein
MNHWLKRKCPLCSSDQIVAGSEVKASFIADEMSFEEVAEFWRGFRKDSCFFTFFRCAGCGLLYCRNYFTEDQLASLYASMGDNSAGVSDVVLERTQRGYFDFVNRIGYRVDGEYLELGPDTGLLTKNFAENGASKIALIEPNQEVRAELLESAKECLDVKIYSDLAQIENNGEFDIVAGIHVYDHLVNLSEDLSSIASFCKDQAKILIVVHDESSLLRKLIGKKWPPFCLQHPQLFNPDTITKALERAGFGNVKVAKSTNWFPLRHIGLMISSLFGISSSWTKFTPKKEVPLRLGNIIVCASSVKTSS